MGNLEQTLNSAPNYYSQLLRLLGGHSNPDNIRRIIEKGSIAIRGDLEQIISSYSWRIQQANDETAKEIIRMELADLITQELKK